MPFTPDQPYNDLPSLPPPVELETKAILRACIKARSALAELKASRNMIPNQSVLINSIPLLEAQASSEIENIVTTADRLFQYVDDGTGADQATKEALRYRTALKVGFQMLEERPLSTAVAVEVCRTIKGAQLDIRNTPGTALVNDATNQVIYTPPEGAALLREKLMNWEQFIHADVAGYGEAADQEELDPLIRLAVMHYQFEAIHPFVDGNGRTGRVLNLLYLVDKGLLDIPILYLSRHIIKNKGDYYRLLLEVTTNGAWEPWVLYILEAIAETSNWTRGLIMALRAQLDETTASMREELPKIYTRELADLIFVKPYCRISDVVEAGIAKRQTASTYLKALVGAGILQEVQAGRENLYINTRMLDLLRNHGG